MNKESKNILLVDDDEIDRIAIKRCLGKAQDAIVVFEATNSTEVIDLLSQQQFDCLLLDYRLGGCDGIDLIKAIQARGLTDAPVVVLSGVDDEAIMLNCLKQGAQDFLLKSEFTTHSLVRAIQYAEERKNNTLQMHYLAQHDGLTGLANRSLFIENVKRAVNRCERAKSRFAIIFLDVDNFKTINDSLGHEAGDMVLTSIADRLKLAVRKEDVVSRLGGDEFAILYEGIVSESSLIKIAQNILNSFKEPLFTAGKIVYSSASLGIATFPKCAGEAATLIKCADLAMYKAKKNGTNDYCFYTEDLQILAENNAILESDLHHAAAHQEFELYYQPQVDAVNNKITGLEALIRWNHPTRGMISPAQFIPFAESIGLINDIGDWVIHKASSQLKTWLSSAGYLRNNFKMSINISAHQMRQANFQEKICGVLNHYQIPYELIELELTETALVDDIGRFTIKLNELNQLGIQFAIDDFGTGFSSFRHLQQLPLKVLKIDKSFIDQICSTKKSYEIVKAMIVMAHALEMTVVAEGIETLEQANLLKTLACEHLQGFYFSKPLAAGDIGKLLEDRNQCYSSITRQEQSHLNDV